MGASQPTIRELCHLRDENTKLKQLVAVLTLDKHILQESLKKVLRTAEKRGVRKAVLEQKLSNSRVPNFLHSFLFSSY
jgi:hypothetical protein